MINDERNLENSQFSLDVKGKKCTMEMVGHLSRLPSKAVESLHLEILRNLLGKFPSNLI